MTCSSVIAWSCSSATLLASFRTVMDSFGLFFGIQELRLIDGVGVNSVTMLA